MVKADKKNNKVKNPEKQSKFITKKFSDMELHEYIEKYYERRRGAEGNDQSILFSTTMKSAGRNTFLSMDRESRDNRFLENYENNRKRWQKYASVLSKKAGRKSPENSIINASDFYVEDLQKKEDFDGVQDNNLQRKINGWYGTLRLSPLDGKLNRNYIPMGKDGKIGASETIHNQSSMLMKKPKELFLFANRPRGTSLLDRLGESKETLDFSLMYKNKHLATNLIRGSEKIAEMDNLFIKGTSKFESEIGYCLRIPENQRLLVRSRDDVEAEKTMKKEGLLEEVIDSNFESNLLY
jgi:hypothetical protein